MRRGQAMAGVQRQQTAMSRSDPRKVDGIRAGAGFAAGEDDAKLLVALRAAHEDVAARRGEEFPRAGSPSYDGDAEVGGRGRGDGDGKRRGRSRADGHDVDAVRVRDAELGSKELGSLELGSRELSS